MKTLKEMLIAEATEHDFKLMLEEKNPISWLKSVSAFANGFGGSLYFGVSDDGVPIGLSDAKHTADRISELIVARIEPSLLYTLEPMLIEGVEILRLVIKSGTNTPYKGKNANPNFTQTKQRFGRRYIILIMEQSWKNMRMA